MILRNDTIKRNQSIQYPGFLLLMAVFFCLSSCTPLRNDLRNLPGKLGFDSSSRAITIDPYDETRVDYRESKAFLEDFRDLSKKNKYSKDYDFHLNRLFALADYHVPSAFAVSEDLMFWAAFTVKYDPKYKTNEKVKSQTDSNFYKGLEYLNIAARCRYQEAIDELKDLNWSLPKGSCPITQRPSSRSFVVSAPSAVQPFPTSTNKFSNDISIRQSETSTGYRQPGPTETTGGTYYHSDGSTSQKIGNTYYHSNGNTSIQIGNHTYHSNGSTSTSIGSTSYHSDGSTSQRIGNSVFHSDGSSTVVIGGK